jgi:hypothetical protein
VVIPGKASSRSSAAAANSQPQVRAGEAGQQRRFGKDAESVDAGDLQTPSGIDQQRRYRRS